MRDAFRAARINVKVVVILLVVIVLLGGGAAVGYKVRKRLVANAALAKGRAAFEQKDWETARKELRDYLSKYPNDVEVLKQYAEAALSVYPLEPRDVGAAIGAYRQLVRINPDDQAAYERLATLYSGLADFSELAYIARKRLEQAPNDPKAPLWLASALLSQHKTEEARKLLEEHVEQLARRSEQYPEYVEACGTLSRLAARAESATAWSNALRWLDLAVEYDPQSPSALVTRARFYRVVPGDSREAREENIARARADLERASGLKAADPRIHLLLSDEWIAHGDLDRAAAELKAVEEVDRVALKKYFLDPGDWLVLRFDHAAKVALLRKAVAAGVELADKVLSPRDPQRAVLESKRHRVLAVPAAVGLYLAGGEVEAAQLCLEELLDATAGTKLTPEREEQISLMKANVAWARARPYEVIEVLEPVVARSPARPVAWRQLAEAFARTNQPRRAVRALIEYLNLEPGDSEAALQLARQYTEQGDWARALEAARLAESLGSTDVAGTLLRLRAGVHAAVEQSDAAVRAGLEALSAELAALRESHPDRVEIRLLQAMIAAQGQRLDAAEEELKRAIVECSDTLPAEMRLAQLYVVTERREQALEVARAACERHANLANPWIGLSELQRGGDQTGEARETLQTGLEAVEGPRERRRLTIALALFDILYGNDRESGIDLLKKLAVEDERDVRVRSLLLELAEVRRDEACAQQLIDELEQIEGKGGLLWHLYQAAVWLSGEEWQSNRQDISDKLSHCIAVDPQWPAPVLLLGRMCEQLGDLDRAEDTYRNALQQNPAAIEVADRLLRLLYEAGRFSEARAVLDQLEADPRLIATRRLGVALGAGDYGEAIEELKLEVANDPNDAGALIRLATLVYLNEKDAAAAFAYLDKAEALSPHVVTLTAARIWILERENRLDEAREMLDELVAREDSAGTRLLRAEFYANVGEIDRAEQEFTNLARLPDNPQGYEHLGRFYVDNDNLDKAVAALEQGLATYPEDVSLKRSLMNVLLLRGEGDDHQRTAAILAELEEESPDAPELLWTRARLTLDQRGMAAAAEVERMLKQIVRRRPTHVDAQLSLIDLAMKRGDHAAARDLAIAALGANRASPRLLLARAEVERALDKPQVAWELARQVLSDDPENAGACSVLVAAALDAGDSALLAGTRELLTEAVAGSPDDAVLQVGLARILGTLGQMESAITKLEAYRQTGGDRDNVDVLLTLADLHRARGDLDTSHERIEAAAAMAPDSAAVLQARIRLLTVQKRFGQIVALVSDYRASHPDDPDVMMTAGFALTFSDQEEHRREARALFERVTTIAPQLTGARVALARLAYQEGDVARAEQGFRAILLEDAANASAANDLAWILMEARSNDTAALEEALELANKAVDLAPNTVQFLGTRGRVLAEFPERLQEARADFEKCVRRAWPGSPERAEAASELARLCLKLNDVAGADRCDNADVMMTAASALASSDQVEHRREARALLEHVTTIAPHLVEAHLAVAVLAHKDGDVARAQQAFRAILAEDPANADAANNLAWLLAEAHADDKAALEEALELANKAVELDPGNVHFLDTRGVVLSKFPERLQDARADLEKCVQLTREASPERGKALLRVARVCLRLNDVAAAKRYLDEVNRIEEARDVLTPDQRRELHGLLEEVGTGGTERPAP